MSEQVTPEEYQKRADTFEEISVTSSGKRCGVWHDPWMGDWFTSWSPRNDNSNAEGPWAHWADLAVRILRDPMTAIVRPEAHQLAQQLEPRDFHGDADVYVSDEQLIERFTQAEDDATRTARAEQDREAEQHARDMAAEDGDLDDCEPTL